MAEIRGSANGSAVRSALSSSTAWWIARSSASRSAKDAAFSRPDQPNGSRCCPKHLPLPDAAELHHGPESADRHRRLSRPTLRTPMRRKPFETDIADDGAHLIGPWRSPRQLLAEQVYDDHVSIHDDATAKRLGFQGGAIEGSTHFSQFAPLGERLWGEAWFETGCLSAHYRNPVFEGEDVQAVMAKPPPSRARLTASRSGVTRSGFACCAS